MATSINFPTYGFINDTLALNEENWRKFFKPFIYDSVQSGLVTTKGTGMTVDISAGECRCGAVMGLLNSSITLDVSNGHSTYDRIDSVMVQYSYSDPSTLSIAIKQGTPSANPVAPEMSKVFSSLWQMEIAQILVPSGATSSSSLTITDKRVIYESIEDAIDDIVISSSTEPTSPMNEIWFQDEPDNEYTVPTNAEFTELEQDVTDLKNSFNEEGIDRINDILTSGLITVSETFTQGKGIATTGNIFDSEKRIATERAFDISSAKILQYSVVTGYRLYIATYNTKDNPGPVNKVNTYGWLTGSGYYVIADNEVSCKICIASQDDSIQCTPSDADKATVSYTNELYYNLKHGLIYKRLIKQTEDLNNIVDPGIYNIANYSQNTIDHIPEGFTGGSLFVFYGYSKLYSYVEPFCMIVQMAISPVNKNIWIRYRSSDGETWNSWVVFYSAQIIAEQTKWLAIGDSITFGVYSYIPSGGGSAVSDTTSNCWVNLLADGMRYEKKIMASRGMGYTVTGQDPLDSSQPRISLDTLLTRIEALTDDYNLITLAFGINDYATDSSTIAEIKTSLNDAIERLVTKFPNSRLVVITPFNSCRNGDASTKFAYNSAVNGRTLKDVADAIKERCEAYGVECLYASDGFLFNSFNIEGLQPDKTHPSLIGHKLIAKTMAHYLMF